MTAAVDFAAEGLLDGLEGAAREGRLKLLSELHADGVGLDELRSAVAEDRLVLLPVERLLGGEHRYSARELAAAAGLDPETLTAALGALGRPAADPDDRRWGASDLAMAHRVRASLDQGLSEQHVVDLNRVIGRAMAQVSAAMRQLVGGAFLQAGDTEDELAARYVRATRGLLPQLGPALEHAFALHLRDLLRGAAIDAAERRAGALAQTRDLAVAFVDIVGFTWLGGQVPADQLGRIARRLEELTAAAIQSPVRLVKTIGDAVLLIAPEPGPLVEAGLALVAAAEAEGEGFPDLRAGVAFGEAQERDGDVYGHAVNLASRLTAIARPGSVLTDRRVRDALRDAFQWSFAGERRIKGLDDELALYRARRQTAAE